MFYDEDGFYGGGEFDEEIEQFKDTLKKSVRKEILDELEALRAENKELQEIKKNFDEVKRDYEKKKADCTLAIEGAKIQAKRARLSEILEQCRIFLYSPTIRRAYAKKCDKCDTWRQVKVNLPSGKIVTDDCSCSVNKSFYEPKKYILCEFSDKYSGITTWYKECESSSGNYYALDRCSQSPENVIDHNVPFEEIPKDRTVFFTTREECEAYCDYISPERAEFIYNLDGSLIKQEGKDE